MAFSVGVFEGPPIWRRPRGSPIWRPPIAVQVKVGPTWIASPAALAAVSKDPTPGRENDRSSASGALRLTLRPGPAVLLCRGRGDLRRLLVDGRPAFASWLGLDAGQGAGWPVQQPRGWHPFQLRVDVGPAGQLELDTQGLKISLIGYRSTGVYT